MTRRPAYHAILPALFLILAFQPIHSRSEGKTKVLFRFQLDEGDVLVVNKYQDIKITRGRTETTKEEKNKISLKVTSSNESISQLEGDFTTYSRSPRQTGNFKLEKVFHSVFTIAPGGAYDVPDRYIMPNLRSLPTFPERALGENETWTGPAEETLDIMDTKIVMPLSVEYRYTGTAAYKDRNGAEKSAHRIEYRYSINHTVRERQTGIAKITGFSADVLFFDTNQGIPVFDTNRLVYNFHMIDGSVLRYYFRIDSWYKKIRHLKEDEKSRLKDKIEENLKQEKDIQVRKSDEGIILDMNAVFFDTNSANLKDEAKESLKSISEILKKHPDREIRISGHTDSTGSSSYNAKLSEERARSVLNELKDRSGIQADRMSYRGYGETKPVESNLTEEGRAKNRRVEILIVTE